MRPVNDLARSKLDGLFRRLGLASAIELSNGLGISPATTLRILKSKPDQIVQIGSTKQARYALRKAIKGEYGSIPVYLIDELGKGHEIGSLETIEPQGVIFIQIQNTFPTDVEHAKGYWTGLPYFLYDMKPQGYLGRNIARKISLDLGVPPDPDRWSDDDTLYALMKRGSDTTGNIIVGEASYQLWLDSKSSKAPVRETNIGQSYAELAEQTAEELGQGSSAGGEFPKFTTSRNLPGSSTPHVIVKYSGNDDSKPVRRWADLLVCEHIALEVIKSHLQLKAATSRIIISNGRTMLETERFDRVGDYGRKSLVSLSSVDGAFLGTGESSWPDAVEKMVKLNLLSREDEHHVLLLWWFGHLIGNTDMHFGNLSLHILDGKFDLAPAYDMLPMMYAPLAGGEIPLKKYSVKMPMPKHRATWMKAKDGAVSFCKRCLDDDRISIQFKKVIQVQMLELMHAEV